MNEKEKDNDYWERFYEDIKFIMDEYIEVEGNLKYGIK